MEETEVLTSGGTITPEEAARVLRVSRRSVYNYLRDGVMPGIRVGGLWRIPSAEFERTFRLTAPTEVTIGADVADVAQVNQVTFGKQPA